MRTRRVFITMATLLLVATLAQAQLYTEIKDLAFDGVQGLSSVQDSNEGGDVLLASVSGPQTVIIKHNLAFAVLRCPNSPPVGTAGHGINSAGTVVGACAPTGGTGEGFLRTASGTWQRLRAPGAQGTAAISISDSPERVVGFFLDATGRYHGFLWQAGRWTTVDAPFAGSDGTFLTAINNRQEIVGYVRLPNGYEQGLRGRLAQLVPFSVPGATATLPLDITDKGEIVGLYSTPAGETESFYFDGQDGFYTIRVPHPRVILTAIEGMTNNNRLVGRVVTTGETPYDFPAYGVLLRRFLEGAATPIAVPAPTGAMVSAAATRQLQPDTAAATAPPATGSLLCPGASRAYQVPLKLQPVAATVCSK